MTVPEVIEIVELEDGELPTVPEVIEIVELEDGELPTVKSVLKLYLATVAQVEATLEHVEPDPED